MREVTEGDALGMPRAYHVVSALLLFWSGESDLAAQYRTLRLASCLYALLTVAATWAGMRVAFGERVANGSVALLVLHPQFLLVSTAVNPDVLVNLSGAVLWWQGARVIRGPSRLAAFSLALAAAVAGALTKRVGLPLLAMACLLAAIALVSTWRASWGERRVRVLLAASGVAAIGGASVLLLRAEWTTAMRYGAKALYDVELPSRAERSIVAFSRSLVESAWLNAGWLTLPAPRWWYKVAMGVSGLAAFAPLVLLVPGRLRRDRAAVALAFAFVVIQLASVYVTYYRGGFGAQGRYLFPVIGPFFALVWLVGAAWPPRHVARITTIVLLAAVVCLDAVSWAQVIIPGFGR